MNKHILVVPKGVRYISEWQDYSFELTPGRCIINKQVPGCGFTEYYLTNDRNVILASPRIMLLKNKYDQHHEEGKLDDIFLVRNELDTDPNIDRNIFKDQKNRPKLQPFKLTPDPEEEEKKKTVYESIKSLLLAYISRRNGEGKPCKILVTYDSYHIVKDILEFNGDFPSFTTMIDEFQVVLDDSRFKADTELGFMRALKDVQKVHFVSATPMLEKYINMLDDFKDLDYYTIDWTTEDPLRLKKPNLDVKIMKSVNTTIDPIIKSYLDGNYEVAFRRDSQGNTVQIESKEACFYVNSVNHILNTIKRNGLTPEQCNILCSDTIENAKKVRAKLGRKWSIGSVPKKGEPIKMFTFCTRTVYLGADFYSTCARSFIFSDANLDCLSVDIGQDMPQILGRQRLEENPWRNSATFYYRSIADYKKMTKEDFDNYADKKKERSGDLLNVVYRDTTTQKERGSLAEAYRALATLDHYKLQYVTADINNGALVPVFNNYAYVSELRAFDIQQIDYKDRFSVIESVSDISVDSDKIKEVSEYVNKYQSLTQISDRIKFICELGLEKGKSSETTELFLNQVPDNDYAKQYYCTLGPERCRALGYNITRIRSELRSKMIFTDDVLKQAFFDRFSVGDRFTRQDLKEEIRKLYDSIGYKANPKASDISLAFNTKPTKTIVNGKRINGLELLSKK